MKCEHGYKLFACPIESCPNNQYENSGGSAAAQAKRYSIKAHKGGRTERLNARLTAEEKAAVMAKVKANGYKSFSDWLMAQIKRG